jgi:hypothetical protein
VHELDRPIGGAARACPDRPPRCVWCPSASRSRMRPKSCVGGGHGIRRAHRDQLRGKP